MAFTADTREKRMTTEDIEDGFHWIRIPYTNSATGEKQVGAFSIGLVYTDKGKRYVRCWLCNRDRLEKVIAAGAEFHRIEPPKTGATYVGQNAD